MVKTPPNHQQTVDNRRLNLKVMIGFVLFVFWVFDGRFRHLYFVVLNWSPSWATTGRVLSNLSLGLILLKPASEGVGIQVDALGLRFNRNTLSNLITGFFLSGLVMSLIYVLGLVIGKVHFTGWGWQQSSRTVADTLVDGSLFMVAASMAAPLLEELIFRGFLLQAIQELWNQTWAVFLTSALFGLLHGSMSAPWQTGAGVSILGFLLALAWVQTKQLWLPIGLHAGWNFFQGLVFGFPVSGNKAFYNCHIICQLPTQSQWDWYTGGVFGPEAGIGVLFALIVGVILACWHRRTKLSNSKNYSKV